MARHRIVESSVVALLFLVGLARPLFAEWRRIDSPNFVVVGDVSAGELREITRRFESFREVLARVLTENGAMLPAASVSGLYFSHPQAKYFNVGRIDRDQLESYAKRKDMSVEEAERWLASNLAYDPAAIAANRC